MILTKDFLSNHTIMKSMHESAEYRVDSRNQNIFIAHAKVYDIFLSHSYLDKSQVLRLVDLFNSCDYSVYVDWIEDEQLDRNSVDSETAMALKARMHTSKGLAYLTSNNTSNSKWCPWELGYFDGKKNSRCCILPVLDYSHSSFNGQEYLGLYPYLDYAKIKGSDKYEFWVNNPSSGAYKKLKDWLNGANP